MSISIDSVTASQTPAATTETTTTSWSDFQSEYGISSSDFYMTEALDSKVIGDNKYFLYKGPSLIKMFLPQESQHFGFQKPSGTRISYSATTAYSSINISDFGNAYPTSISLPNYQIQLVIYTQDTWDNNNLFTNYYLGLQVKASTTTASENCKFNRLPSTLSAITFADCNLQLSPTNFGSSVKKNWSTIFGVNT